MHSTALTPIRNRNLSLGVALSGTIGNAIDSYLFLIIAFGGLGFFWGQFWGKTEMIAIGTLLTAMRRRVVPVAA